MNVYLSAQTFLKVHFNGSPFDAIIILSVSLTCMNFGCSILFSSILLLLFSYYLLYFHK